MESYFTGKTCTYEVPENIIADVRRIFSKFEVEYFQDGKVEVKVPADEKAIVNRFRHAVHQLLLDVEKENSVLAQKLARQYEFR